MALVFKHLILRKRDLLEGSATETLMRCKIVARGANFKPNNLLGTSKIPYFIISIDKLFRVDTFAIFKVNVLLIQCTLSYI